MGAFSWEPQGSVSLIVSVMLQLIRPEPYLSSVCDVDRGSFTYSCRGEGLEKVVDDLIPDLGCACWSSIDCCVRHVS